MKNKQLKSDEINLKINEIELILEDNKNIEKYLNTLEDIKYQIPNDLHIKILNKLKINERNTNYKEKIDVIKLKPKFNYLNVLKIVSCTIFSIILWETVLSKEVSYANSDKINNLEINSFYSKLDEKIKVISEFFLEPINLERGEK